MKIHTHILRQFEKSWIKTFALGADEKAMKVHVTEPGNYI